jgi:DNA-binding CsgD family transcriptional regulator
MDLVVATRPAAVADTSPTCPPRATRSMDAARWRVSSRTPADALVRRCDDLTTVRVLTELGVPFAVFDDRGAPRELSVAATALLEDDPSAARAWRQAGVLADSALAAHRHGRCGGERLVRSPLAVGPWSLHAHVLSTHDARRVVVVLLLPAATTATASPADDHGLTPREAQVARLIAEGASAKDVAKALAISVHTARRHTEHVFEKLGVQSRTQLVLLLRAAPRPPRGGDARDDESRR